jgi:hypothetical protein
VLRLFLALTIFFTSIYGCKGGYSACVDKVKDAKVIKNNSLYIPVKNSKLLVYSTKKPATKILKYDPF